MQSDKPLTHYEALLCLTGGIACYKSADLASKLVQAGCGVSVAMTSAARRFITPLTLQTVTSRAVYRSLWQGTRKYESGHISLTELADLMIVAPATADIMAKMATGIADDLISSLALSSTGECPVLIAPAMNTRMWNAPATQANVARLREWGFHFIGPSNGRLACGTTGEGRMCEPAEILEEIKKIMLQRPPKRKRHHESQA